MIKQCAACNGLFDAGNDHWKTLCLPCFKRARPIQPQSNESKYETLVAKIKQQAAEIAALKVTIKLMMEREMQTQQHRSPAQKIPDDMLRRITMLCHPDKHGGSEAASAAFIFLRKLKE